MEAVIKQMAELLQNLPDINGIAQKGIEICNEQLLNPEITPQQREQAEAQKKEIEKNLENYKEVCQSL
jgi:predicted ATP-grasp superfamily ATP-dependent carboligase